MKIINKVPQELILKDKKSLTNQIPINLVKDENLQKKFEIIILDLQ
jgi:hypothetical protein